MSERIFQLVDDIDVIGKTESDEQVARDKLAHSQRLWPHRNPRLIRTDTERTSPMTDPKKDLVVTLTIPTDEDSDVTVNVSGATGETITQGEVVYYLFQTATSILSHMSESEHGATIQMIEEFFE